MFLIKCVQKKWVCWQHWSPWPSTRSWRDHYYQHHFWMNKICRLGGASYHLLQRVQSLSSIHPSIVKNQDGDGSFFACRDHGRTNLANAAPKEYTTQLVRSVVFKIIFPGWGRYSSINSGGRAEEWENSTIPAKSSGANHRLVHSFTSIYSNSSSFFRSAICSSFVLEFVSCTRGSGAFLLHNTGFVSRT